MIVSVSTIAAAILDTFSLDLAHTFLCLFVGIINKISNRVFNSLFIKGFLLKFGILNSFVFKPEGAVFRGCMKLVFFKLRQKPSKIA